MKQHLSKVIFLLTLIVCGFSYNIGTAQQPLSDSLSTLNNPNKAISFGIGGSSGITLQYWLNKNNVILGGAGFSLSTQRHDIGAQTSLFDILGVNLLGQYRYYWAGRQQFAPFWGFGTSIGWQQSKLANAVTQQVVWTLGTSIGMECFVLPWLSVTGQIGLGANYTLYGTERFVGSFPSEYMRLIRLDLGTSGVIVAIYF